MFCHENHKPSVISNQRRHHEQPLNMLATTKKYLEYFFNKSAKQNRDVEGGGDNNDNNLNNLSDFIINNNNNPSDSDSLCDSRNNLCDNEMVQLNNNSKHYIDSNSCGRDIVAAAATKKELEIIFTSNCKIDSCFNGSSSSVPQSRPEDDEMRDASFNNDSNNNNDDNVYEVDFDESDLVVIDQGEDEEEPVGEEENENLMPTDNNKIVSMELSVQTNRMRVALGVLFRLILPFVNGVVNSTRKLRNARAVNVVRNLRSSRSVLTNMLAYAANTISLSLSSVQVVHRIPPMLRSLKFRKQNNLLTNGPATTPSSYPILETQSSIESIGDTEKCVTFTILAEPPAGTPIRADVIFIHGLHGSLKKTWKQGVWNSEGRPVKFDRPPKPEIRPPKRPRHSRSTNLPPPLHHSKRPRIEEADQYFTEADKFCGLNLKKILNENEEMVSNRRKRVSFYCDEPDPDNTEFVDEVEFSFPRFRYRIESDEEATDLSDEVEVNNNRDADGRKQETNQTDEKWSACWPGDWLPLDCPGVRVIALDYTTDPYLWRPLWVQKRNRTSLEERSREMTRILVEHGVGAGHPIVWVGHSKGGIFIKQIIVDAYESGRASSASIWRSSRGVLFYSVPHRGSPLADFNLPLLRQSIELLEIQKNCPSILELHRRFVALYRSGQLQVQVFSFVETALTLMSVLYLRIVGVDSADPGIGEVCGVHLDHREICKPRNRNCMLYTELTKMINKVS